MKPIDPDSWDDECMDVIQERQLASEQGRISQNISSYYDSLSVEEQEENRVWGKFAESLLSK
ncbi:MAG: hypothetical protein LAO06_08725 [Acidobacteriia bacterium]|nr:hypothetical protein [Terriglobia bacterium]